MVITNKGNDVDVDKPVFFYERDFYVLSNFSAFKLIYAGQLFDTSEAAYHYMKFYTRPKVQFEILNAFSAHEAFKIAQANKPHQDVGWDERKVLMMKTILLEKVEQHPYVYKKLIQTGNREIIEDSWRDDFWGWGPNRDGQNMLGKLWMEIRSEID